MSKETATEEMVETNFEKFAENAGWNTEELADHLYAEFGSEKEKDDLMEGVSFEKASREETEETEDDETPEDGVKCGECGKVLATPHGLKTHAGQVHPDKDVSGTPEDTKDSEGINHSEKPDSWFPYTNSFEYYDDHDDYDVSAITEPETVRNHPQFDGSGNIDQIRHKQAKHGVCNVCEVFYAGKGETCHSCPEDGTTEDTSEDTTNADRVERVMDTFDVKNSEAKRAVKDDKDGLFGTVRKALLAQDAIEA